MDFLTWLKNTIKTRQTLLCRTASIASLTWLTMLLPFLALYNGGVRPFFTPGIGFPDLAQYYMGGSIVLAEDYASLYPVQKKQSQGNMGLTDNSTPKPGYKKITETKGVEDSLRYILPPPSAFLFVPFALIPYPIERWVWTCALGLFIWLACLLAHRNARQCGGGDLTATAGCMLMIFSPLVNNAIRIGNCTPFLAVALGVAANSIYKNQASRAVGGCIVAGLLKGTSIIFAPLLLIMQRWRIIIWGGIIAIAITFITVLITGWSVYEEFLNIIYPSMRLIVPDQYNRSIYACLYRIIGDAALTGPIPLIVKTTGMALGGVLCAILWKIRNKLAGEPPTFNAAVIALLGLYIIFSPYAWLHYALCYYPFLPALWGGLKGRWAKGIMLMSFFAMWLPPGIRLNLLSPYLPEPLASHFLLGQIGIIALAFYVLIKNVRQTSAR